MWVAAWIGPSRRYCLARFQEHSLLFLAFDGRDESLARLLATRLRGAGLDVWCSAADSMEPGAFREQLYDALDRCSVFVALLGANAFGGGLKEESDYAIDRHNKSPLEIVIVPLRLTIGAR